MKPCSCHSASNIGLLAGTSMYLVICGTISSSQTRSAKRPSASASSFWIGCSGSRAFIAGSWSCGERFSVSSQAVSTPKTSSCSGSLKISWKSDANGRAVTTAAGAAAANAALPAGTTRRSLPA